MKPVRSFKHIKQFWAIIGDKRIFFRSNFEYKYATKLESYKKLGIIEAWEHEPQTFYFEGIKRGTTNYKPDFKVINNDGSHHWVETKGYFDKKSITKIKRFIKYFPNENLIFVNQ